MTKNPNITCEFIEKHINENWDWSEISKNPNITLEFIEKYIKKIDFKKLSENKFIYHNKLVKKKIIQLLYYFNYINLIKDIQRYILSKFI